VNYSLAMNTNNSIDRLKQFMDDEARSCSMDYGCVTPLYVYRMWGGSVAIESIETALAEINKRNLIYR